MTHEALLTSQPFGAIEQCARITIILAKSRGLREVRRGAPSRVHFYALSPVNTISIQILHDLLPAVPRYKSAVVLEEGVFLAPLCRTPLTPVAWICNSMRAFLCAPKLPTNTPVVAILRDLAVDSRPLGRYALSGGG